MSRSAWNIRFLIRKLVKLRLLWLILVAFFLLSGCVQSDISLRFSDANHGKLVQHIRLQAPATELENAFTVAWLDRVAQQTADLGGRSRYASPEELVLTLPFFNAKDLEQKFNQLLQVELQPERSQQRYLSRDRVQHKGEPPAAIESRLRVRSGNWILWQRFVLQYDLDLRSLDLLSTQQKLAFDPRDLLSLEFRLKTPWGGRSLSESDAPKIRRQGKQLIWALHPGEVNHLESVFWLPSPLGIGAVSILLLVLLGMLVKIQPPKTLTNA